MTKHGGGTVFPKICGAMDGGTQAPMDGSSAFWKDDPTPMPSPKPSGYKMPATKLSRPPTAHRPAPATWRPAELGCRHLVRSEEHTSELHTSASRMPSSA